MNSERICLVPGEETLLFIFLPEWLKLIKRIEKQTANAEIYVRKRNENSVSA